MWYVVENGQRAGPFAEPDFAAMVSSGRVGRETLVWREGMASWQPYIALFEGVPAAPATSAVACTECGKTFPESDLLPHHSARVCAACKPLFVQKLREGVPVLSDLVYAPFGVRVSAWLVDYLILMIANIGLMLAATGTVGFNPDAGFVGLGLWGLSSFLGFAIQIGYKIYFHGRYGATPGKMLAGIRVVSPDGSPITYGKAGLRWISEIVSGLTCYIGYLMPIFDEEGRSLHDRLANTRVVVSASLPVPVAAATSPGGPSVPAGSAA